MSPSCGTCRFADPTVLPEVDHSGPAAVLLCRRMPPTPVAEDDGEGGGVAPAWPIVHEGEWCGEWEAGE